MPRGPKGEKRPADAIGAAIRVAKIATGEIEEDVDDGGGDLKPPLDPEEGTVRRRDAALKRMLETPPRQHQEDVGKGRKPKSTKRKPV